MTRSRIGIPPIVSGIVGFRLLGFGLAAVVLTLLVGALGHSPPQAFDRALLLRLNLDHPPAGLDTAMLVVADFSVPAVAVILVAWELAFQLQRRWPAARSHLPLVFLVAGVVTAGILTLVALGKPPGEELHFHWMAPLAVLGFGIAGRSFLRDDDALARLHGSFVACLAAGLAGAVGREWIGDHLAFRPRPLSPSFHPWNEALREVLGETVRTGSSYVSGHATALFAILTPLVVRSRDRSVKLALIVWACLHAYTRLYLAAHFPYGALMGSLYGAGLGALATAFLAPPGRDPRRI